jgi:hypothetical protein
MEERLKDYRMTKHGLKKRMKLDVQELSPEFKDAMSTAENCCEGIQQLSEKLQAIFENDAVMVASTSSANLTDSEISQLLQLNRRLHEITGFLLAVADDVTPRLDAKVADPDDPVYDYKADARIDYQLREDDPEFADDDDNFLTSRTEPLECLLETHRTDWSEAPMQANLKAEPHCWLFHDLYDHDYGRQSPRVPLRDCLRIGKIFVDVQIWQQYAFDTPIDRK